MQRNQRSPGSDTMRLRRVRLVSYAVHPEPQKGTGRLRGIFLAFGAVVTGLCQRRLGCRPSVIQLVRLSNEEGACCAASFVFTPVTDRRPKAAPTHRFVRRSPARLGGRGNWQFCTHSGSKRVRNVSLPGAGSVAIRFLFCAQRKF